MVNSMENNEERLKVEKVIKLHEEELSDRKRLTMWRTWLIISGLMSCAFFVHLVKDFTDISNIRPIIRDALVMVYSGISLCIAVSNNDKIERSIKEKESQIKAMKNEDKKTR